MNTVDLLVKFFTFIDDCGKLMDGLDIDNHRDALNKVNALEASLDWTSELEDEALQEKIKGEFTKMRDVILIGQGYGDVA